MNNMIKRGIKCIPMLLMMSVIFIFSMQNGETSGGLSFTIAEFISNAAGRIGLMTEPESIHLLIRKCAHMTEYGLLFVTVMWALSGLTKRLGAAYMVTVLYAASDEVHQSFIPGRCAAVTDVLIDGAGALTALIIYFVVLKKTKGSK